MWLFNILSLLVVAALGRENVGYFWHVTDIHFDTSERGCFRIEYERNGGSRSQKRPAGRFGHYGCDSPWALIQSAAKHMKTREDVDFVLWTGDAISTELLEEHSMVILRNLTTLLISTFVYHSIYPALGHDDPHSKMRRVAELWKKWLPFDDKTKPFEKGGYYLIERKSKVPQILVLNTNFLKEFKKNQAKFEAAEEQWEWLGKVLKKMKENGERVFLVGHMPPGSYVRSRTPNEVYRFSDFHNKRYLNLTQVYADIIVGQFFGHLHYDTFRVMYNKQGQPISWAMIAPAVSPRLSNNPALRLYKFNRDTGQVLDYTQYFLNLSNANSNVNEEPNWEIEYTFCERYGLQSITPNSLHNLAEKMTQTRSNGNPTFKSYYEAHFVGNSPQMVSCDSNCVHQHYCAITKVDYTEYEHCLKTPASALSATAISIVSAPLYIVLSTTVLWKM